MGKQDYLQELIRSLTKPEKRYFKLFASRYKREGGKRYLDIFEALDNERLTAGSIDREKYSRNLAADKHYLSEMLITSLRQFHAESTVQMRIGNDLLAAGILQRRGLFTHALSRIARARKEAVRYEIAELVAQAIAMEIEIRYYTSLGWPETIQELTDEMNRWLQHQIYLNTLNRQRAEQVWQAVEKGRPSSPQELREWKKRLSHFDPDINVTGLATETAMRLRTYSHVLFVIQDMERAHEINTRQYQLYCDKPELAEKNMIDYLAFLFRYATTSTHIGNYYQAGSLLSEIRSIRDKEEKDSFSESAVFIDERLLSMEIFLFGKSKRYDKMRAKEKEAEHFIRTNPSNQQAVIGFNMSTAFVFSGDWRKVILWAHRSLIYPGSKKNYMLFLGASLHQLIAYIATDDFEAAASRAGALRRYIAQRQTEQSSADMQLIRVLYRIAAATDKTERAKIAAEFLEEWEKNEFFVQTSEYVAIHYWLGKVAESVLAVRD